MNKNRTQSPNLFVGRAERNNMSRPRRPISSDWDDVKPKGEGLVARRPLAAERSGSATDTARETVNSNLTCGACVVESREVREWLQKRRHERKHRKCRR